MSATAPASPRVAPRAGYFAAMGCASLALLLLSMALLFLAFGFFYPYWRKADQDLLLAYEGLLFAQGLPQGDFTHTGYLAFMLIGAWYRVLHAVGLLPIHTVAELPPARDVAAFDAAWQHLVAAGRVLSLLLAAAFVWIFATGVRRLVGDGRIALLAGVALAYSASIALHTRMMRTELLSATLTGTALLLALLAARQVTPRWRPPLLALAALCATLAVVTKVQAVLVVLAIPVIVQTFGRASSAARQRIAEPLAWTAAVVILGVPAAMLFLHGFAVVIPATYRPVGILPPGAYQAMFVIWVIAGMLLYARIWRVRLADTVSAMAAVAVGVALGLLSLKLRYADANLVAVTHPVEHLFYFATWRTASLAEVPQILGGTLLLELARGLVTMLVANVNFLSRPTVLLEWFAIVGAVGAWRRGDRQLPLQVAALILAVWGLETIFSLRYLNNNYFAYTDPFLIVAAALVAVRFPNWRTAPKSRQTVATVFAVYIVLGMIPSVGLAFDRRGPESVCEWLPTYLPRVEPFRFCAGPPPAGQGEAPR